MRHPLVAHMQARVQVLDAKINALDDVVAHWLSAETSVRRNIDYLRGLLDE